MKRLLVGLFSCLSRALNVLRGGHPDMTLSAAAFEENLACKPYIDAFFWHVFGEMDHCERWFWSDFDLAKKAVAKGEQLKQTLTMR